MSGHVKPAARRAGDHPALELTAKLGYAASGVLHLVLAWIGVQLAARTYEGSADQSGALQTLSGSSLGALSLWVGVVGFAGLALWQATEAVAGSDTSDRLKAVSKAVVHAVLAVSCLGYARHDPGRSGRSRSVDATGTLMEQPAGRSLVVLLGLVVVGVGGYHVVKGWREKFLEDLREHPGPSAVVLGRVGYVAKGVALVAVGALFAVAGLHGNAKEGSGLDGALRSLLDLPFGRVIVVVVAAGLAAYGLYSLARARYAKV